MPGKIDHNRQNNGSAEGLTKPSGLSGSEWVGVGRSGLEWVGVGRSGLEWVGVGWSGLEWVGMGWSGSEWVGVVGVGWNGRSGLEWAVARILILRSGEERNPPLLCFLAYNSPTESWLGYPQLCDNLYLSLLHIISQFWAHSMFESDTITILLRHVK